MSEQTVDHLARAKEYIAVAESGDARAEAYKQAAAQIAAWIEEDGHRTQADAAKALGRSKSWVGKLLGSSGSATPFGGQDENEARYERQAKTALKDPERRARALSELPSEQVEEIAQQATGTLVERHRATRAEQLTEPTARELMGGEKWDPSESWADSLIMRLHTNARHLSKQVDQWGFVLGSLSAEDAFAYLQEAERLVAEIRAAAQERAMDAAEA